MLIKEICITAILNQIQSETVSPKKPVVLSVILAENAAKLPRTFQVHQQ